MRVLRLVSGMALGGWVAGATACLALVACAPDLPAEARWVDECVAWEPRTEVVPRAGSIDFGVSLGPAFKVVTRRHCVATVPVCIPGTREPCPAGGFVHPMTGEPIAP